MGGKSELGPVQGCVCFKPNIVLFNGSSTSAFIFVNPFLSEFAFVR